ncbi:hypothetical protein D3C73_942820 [compost metagenome]
MCQQTLRIVSDGVRHDVDPRAEQRCGEELPDRDVEALRSGLRDHVGLAQVQVRHLAQLVIEHAALFDHYALRQTGGAGGVDHVGQVVRAAVDARIGHRNIARLHIFPDQQLRSIGTAELFQQRVGLFTTRLGADQQRRTAQVDDAAQALSRQARVQRQITCAGLEAADDHAKQIEVAFSQQRHRLIAPDPGSDQGVTESVTALVQLGKAVLLIEATGSDPLRMRRDLRFKQGHIALLKRIFVCTLVATVDQEVLFLGTEQRQVSHVTVEPFDQRQQQALELTEHALDGVFVEVTLVVRQVQAQVIAWIAHGRQREVGVGTTGIGGRVEALRTVQHRGFHRGVFEHEQAVEQRLALRQFALLLDVH